MGKTIKYGGYILLYLLMCAIAVALIIFSSFIVHKIGINASFIYGAAIFLLAGYAIYITYNFYIVVKDHSEHHDEKTDSKSNHLQIIKMLYIIPIVILIITIVIFLN